MSRPNVISMEKGHVAAHDGSKPTTKMVVSRIITERLEEMNKRFDD